MAEKTDLQKNIDFAEMVNREIMVNPELQKLVVNTEPFRQYIAEVHAFNSITAEQWFESAPRSVWAAEIQAKRLTYEGILEADAVDKAAQNAVADELAKLREQVATLMADKAAPAAVEAPPAVVEPEATPEVEPEAEATPDVEAETETDED